MATKAVNAKSQTIAARIPHDVIDLMVLTKEDGESTGKYIASAIQTEAKRRQRKYPTLEQLARKLKHQKMRKSKEAPKG